MPRPRRQIVVVLEPEDWDRLVALARRADRDAWQHARVLLRRALDAEAGSSGLAVATREAVTLTMG